MRMAKLTALSAGLVGLVLSGAGCFGGFGGDDRSNNQGGGDILSAGLKVASGSMTSLTPDEIQAASDFAIQQTGAPVPEMTDDQAAAVVQFLKDNNLNRVEDIQSLAENPGNVVVAQEVEAAVESFLSGLGEDFDFEAARAGANG